MNNSFYCKISTALKGKNHQGGKMVASIGFLRAISVKYVFKPPSTLGFRLLHMPSEPAQIQFPAIHEFPYASAKITTTTRAVQIGWLQQIQIETCGKLFQQWREEERYWKVPDGDVQFTVKHLDTGCGKQSGQDSPVILILPGSPGGFSEFLAIASLLHEKDIRVVIPTFPDYTTLKGGMFRHTPEEKSEYVKDFLKAKNINAIDMLICHSSGFFPGLQLCQENIFPIKCTTFLNPTAFAYPSLIIWRRVTHFLIRYLEVQMKFSPINILAFIANLKSPQSTMDDLILGAIAVVVARPPEKLPSFKEILNRKHPVMMIFSDNDGIIHKKDLYNMAEIMVKKEDIKRYDQHGKMQKEGGEDAYRRVVSFPKGTHFVSRKHPEVIANEIEFFLLQHMRPQQ